ncbi:unnamed protein product [Pieris macdunnoughi]|uniref:Uncharacterized protein n=1 Tax=Pieris macdunnoughi TaxID=345717 RepID=A0A821SLF4_9NEOP|nr:unnamed protein product [Pieris macdunnoughi]
MSLVLDMCQTLDIQDGRVPLRLICLLFRVNIPEFLQCIANRHIARRGPDNLDKIVVTGRVDITRPQSRFHTLWTDEVKLTGLNITQRRRLDGEMGQDMRHQLDLQ